MTHEARNLIAPIPWDGETFAPASKRSIVSGTVEQSDLDFIADQLENMMLVDERCYHAMERFWRIAKYVLLIAGAEVPGLTIYEDDPTLDLRTGEPRSPSAATLSRDEDAESPF